MITDKLPDITDQSKPKAKGWVARHKVATVVLGVVAVFAIAGVASGNQHPSNQSAVLSASSSAHTSTPSSSHSQAPTPSPVHTSTPVSTPRPAPIATAAPISAPAPAAQGCTPLTNGGNCYEPGEFCRTSDRGASGVAGDGERIACEDNDGWRWEPV